MCFSHTVVYVFCSIVKTNRMKPFLFVKEMQCVYCEVGKKSFLFFKNIYMNFYLFLKSCILCLLMVHRT